MTKLRIALGASVLALALTSVASSASAYGFFRWFAVPFYYIPY